MPIVRKLVGSTNDWLQAAVNLSSVSPLFLWGSSSFICLIDSSPTVRPCQCPTYISKIAWPHELTPKQRSEGDTQWLSQLCNNSSLSVCVCVLCVYSGRSFRVSFAASLMEEKCHFRYWAFFEQHLTVHPTYYGKWFPHTVLWKEMSG